MIVTQTPLRIGIVGGGTDLPGYYREHGGRVLNCTLDKYVYVIVKERFDRDIYVNYSKKEVVSRSRTCSTNWCARRCWPPESPAAWRSPRLPTSRHPGPVSGPRPPSPSGS